MPQSPARILFIEDEPAIRESVTTALAGAGYLVRSRAHGPPLRELAGWFRPDLAVLDITLPGPDGCPSRVGSAPVTTCRSCS